MDDELKALLQRVGLRIEHVLTRKRFLQWQPADAQRLNRVTVDVDATHRRFIDKLYAHLGDFGPAAELLSDPAGVARLKHSQHDYTDAYGMAPTTATTSGIACWSGWCINGWASVWNGTWVPTGCTCPKCWSCCWATPSSMRSMTAC